MTTKNNPDVSKDTVSMLAQHHGDGEAFAELMEQTFENRFNEEFWSMWDSNFLPNLKQDSVVLDLGSGPGTLIKALANRHPELKVVGVECAPYMISAVGDLPANASLLEADLQNPRLEFADNSISAAITSAVIHEMIQPIRMFKELQRVLKTGARLYIFDWVRAPLESYLKRSETDPFEDDVSQDVLEDLFVHFIEHNRFSLDDLVFMLKHTGFDLLDSGFKNEGQHAWLLAEKTA